MCFATHRDDGHIVAILHGRLTFLHERDSSFSIMAYSNYWKVTPHLASLNDIYVNICTFQIGAVQTVVHALDRAR